MVFSVSLTQGTFFWNNAHAVHVVISGCYMAMILPITISAEVLKPQSSYTAPYVLEPPHVVEPHLSRTSSQRSGTSSQLLETSSQRSGTSSQRLEMSSQRSGTSSQRLETSSQRSGMSSQRLETSSQRSGTSYQPSGILWDDWEHEVEYSDGSSSNSGYGTGIERNKSKFPFGWPDSEANDEEVITDPSFIPPASGCLSTISENSEDVD